MCGQWNLCSFGFCSASVLTEIFLNLHQFKTMNKEDCLCCTKVSNNDFADLFCAGALQHLARLVLSAEIIQSWKLRGCSGLFWHISYLRCVHGFLWSPIYTGSFESHNFSKKISLGFLYFGCYFMSQLLSFAPGDCG